MGWLDNWKSAGKQTHYQQWASDEGSREVREKGFSIDGNFDVSIEFSRRLVDICLEEQRRQIISSGAKKDDIASEVTTKEPGSAESPEKATTEGETQRGESDLELNVDTDAVAVTDEEAVRDCSIIH